MSMFDKYKILHGLPKVGQKIIFKEPVFTWFTNVEEDTKKLVPNQEYTVRKTEMGSSATYVWLEEFPNIFDPNDLNDGRDQPFFSMYSFEWDKPEINLEDLIGYQARDLGTLSTFYEWGIQLKDKVWLEGDPMLIVDYDEYDNVTEVKFK